MAKTKGVGELSERGLQQVIAKAEADIAALPENPELPQWTASLSALARRQGLISAGRPLISASARSARVRLLGAAVSASCWLSNHARRR